MTATTALPKSVVGQALRATVARDQLLDVLRFVTWAVPRRAPVPVLAGVLLEGGRGQLQVKAFDYDVHAAAAAVAAGSRGSALVEAHRLLQMVRALDKGCDVTLAADRGVLKIAGGGVTYTLPVLPIEEYPDLPEPAGEPVAALTGADLQDLARVTVAAGRDGTLPVLTGVLLHDHDGHLAAAATDRYRLALWQRPIENTLGSRAPLLVPAGVLRWVAQQFRAERTVELRQQPGADPRLHVAAGGRAMSVRLLDGQFPKVWSLLSDSFATTAHVAAADLARAVSQVAIALERHSPVRLAVAAGKVELLAGAGVVTQARDDRPDEYGPTATKDVPAEVAGEDVTIAFNPGYLLDGIRTLGADQVDLRFNASGRPAVLRADGDPAFTYLVMPVRTSS